MGGRERGPAWEWKVQNKESLQKSPEAGYFAIL